MEILKTLRSSAMFCFGRELCTILHVFVRKRARNFVKCLYNPHMYTRGHKCFAPGVTRKCRKPFVSYSPTFFAQYPMTVKSWLLEKWSRAKLKNGFEYTTSLLMMCTEEFLLALVLFPTQNRLQVDCSYPSIIRTE